MRSQTYLMLGILLLATGCGDSVAPVSGRVTLDNKPLANASVVFQPDASLKNAGPGSFAKTDANGQYTLMLMSKDREVNGAILGKHVVSITAYEGDDAEIPSSGSDMNPFRKRILPEKYNSESILTFEVPAGGSSNAHFDLKSDK